MIVDDNNNNNNSKKIIVIIIIITTTTTIIIILISFFQKEKADLEKLKLILKPEEMSATVNLQTPHERMQHLEQVYQELEAHYKKTNERIAAT